MAIEASKLDVALEERERWRRTLKVTVPASVMDQERRKVLKRVAGRLNLPGFREGQVPASVVEKRYGQAVSQEILDRVVGEAYREALKLESLQPISEGEVESIDYEPEQDLRFSISFDVRPEIEVARLGGFVVEKPDPEVSDDDVDQVLQRLREQNGTWVPSEEGKPVAGDLVSLSVRKLVDGEPEGEPQDYDLTLGEGDAIPDVESAIYTLEPGETGDFTVTFPEDFPNEERRGEKQHLRITLQARKVRELPELDNEFARSLGDFEDLDSLREQIREDLEAEAADQVEGAVRGRLVQQLLDANAFEAPNSMVDRYIDSVLGDTEGADPDKVARAREEIRPEAERTVKRILLVNRIAEIQELEATEDELDERIETIAKKNDTNPSEVYARLQKSGRLEALEREITERKVFEFLKSQSEIVPAGSDVK